MEVVASLSQGRTAAAQCGLFTHKSVPVLFEPPCKSVKKFISCYFSQSEISPNHLIYIIIFSDFCFMTLSSNQ